MVIKLTWLGWKVEADYLGSYWSAKYVGKVGVRAKGLLGGQFVGQEDMD